MPAAVHGQRQVRASKKPSHRSIRQYVADQGSAARLSAATKSAFCSQFRRLAPAGNRRFAGILRGQRCVHNPRYGRVVHAGRGGLRLVERPRDEQMVALRADGLSLAQIGARFGVTRQRVDQILRQAGVAQAGTARSRAVRASRLAALRELHTRLAAERCGEILELLSRG